MSGIPCVKQHGRERYVFAVNSIIQHIQQMINFWFTQPILNNWSVHLATWSFFSLHHDTELSSKLDFFFLKLKFLARLRVENVFQRNQVNYITINPILTDGFHEHQLPVVKGLRSLLWAKGEFIHQKMNILWIPWLRISVC